MVSPVHGVPATINTATAGTTTYTFTPADLVSVRLPLTMRYCDHCTGNTNVYSIGPLCQN